MARARKTRLTDVGVARLKPAASEYTVWDMRVQGILPRSGDCPA